MDLTIVIPVLNRRALIRRTLESIMRSPVWPVQVIAVDNGSTDGTLQVLEQYALEHPEISVLQESRRSAAAARNRGLAAVRTTWVHFFDSDDIFEDLPHTWDSTMDLVAFPTRQKADDWEKVRAYRPVQDPAIHILNGMLNTISMIMRASWVQELGGWNPDCLIWDDWELGLRALLASPKMQWLTSKSYHCAMVHGDSITGPNLRSGIQKQLACIETALADCAPAPQDIRQRCMKALCYRLMILSGKLMYEGDREASAACRRFIESHKELGQPGLAGRWLELYSSLGGRGAWKMASAFISVKK